MTTDQDARLAELVEKYRGDPGTMTPLECARYELATGKPVVSSTFVGGALVFVRCEHGSRFEWSPAVGAWRVFRARSECACPEPVRELSEPAAVAKTRRVPTAPSSPEPAEPATADLGQGSLFS